MMATLTVQGLSKTYRQAAEAAVCDFTHSFAPGRITALLGPSGSGKSTTLAMIAGLLEPDAGAVLYGGEDLTGVLAEQREFGIVFQSYALFPHLTARENVEFGLRVRGIGAGERRRRALEMLELVRIPQLAERRPAQLSGGEQQRIALARALAFRPRVLLMDEPLSALDAKLRDELRAELSRLLAELALTTIYVTHDQGEAMSLGHELVIMHRGRIEQCGAPSDLYRRPSSPFVAEFLGSANVFAGECAQNGRGLMVRLPFGELVAPEGTSKGKCWAMVRPEQIEVTTPAEAQFHARVESAFFLGGHTRLHLRVGETALLADVPSHVPIVSPEALPLRVRDGGLYVQN